MYGRGSVLSKFIFALIFPFHNSRSAALLPDWVCDHGSLSKLCEPDYRHCIPAREPRKSAAHHARHEYPWLNDPEIVWRSQDRCVNDNELYAMLRNDETPIRLTFSTGRASSCGATAVRVLTATMLHKFTSNFSHTVRLIGDKIHICYSAASLLVAAQDLHKASRRPQFNLAVLSVDDRALDPNKTDTYWSLTVTMQMVYAISHGYFGMRAGPDIVRKTNFPPDMKDRDPSWLKLPALSFALTKHQYVILVDSDAFFYDLTQRAESLFQNFNMFGAQPIKLIALSQDTVSTQSKGGLHNLGVSFWRDGELVQRMLRQWASSVDLRRGQFACPSRYKTSWSVEQICFHLVIWRNKKYSRFVHSLPPGKPFNHPWGAYIKHYWGKGYWFRERKWAMSHAFHHVVWALFDQIE